MDWQRLLSFLWATIGSKEARVLAWNPYRETSRTCLALLGPQDCHCHQSNQTDLRMLVENPVLEMEKWVAG